MEGVDLEVRSQALQQSPKKALERKTGARGLRSIPGEQDAHDLMFDLPTMENVSKSRGGREHHYRRGQAPSHLQPKPPKVAGTA